LGGILRFKFEMGPIKSVKKRLKSTFSSFDFTLDVGCGNKQKSVNFLYMTDKKVNQHPEWD